MEIKEVPLEDAIKFDAMIPEFDGENKLAAHIQRMDDKSLCIMAFDDGVACGYMTAYDRYKDGSFYCWMTGVLPEHRGKGVLKQMMDFLFGWAKKNGYTSVKMKTRNNRREMLAYLVKYGWDFIEMDDRDSVGAHRILLEKRIIK